MSGTIESCRLTSTESGSSGSKALSGGLTGVANSRLLPLSFVGDKGNTCGGADIDFRDFGAGRAGTEDLRARGRTGEGRMGEDDSAPDWKTLLSSQPDSGSSVKGRETRLACVPASAT